MTATLERFAAEFEVPLPVGAREGLLAYGRLLLTWGQRINLTAARSVTGLAWDHFPDAFAIAHRLAVASGSSPRIVDVGSGGGLPALPLALLRPDSSFVLFEATGKKVAFLRTALRTVGLGDRVQVQHARMDRPGPAFEAVFDVAVSRATLPPPAWLALAWRLVRPGGTVFCLGTRRIGQGGEAGGAADEIPPQLSLVDQASYRADRWVAELKRST